MHRPSFLVVVEPDADGRVRLTVPQLGDLETVALDLTEGEVLIRQAIALETDLPDASAIEVDLVDRGPGI